MKPRRVLILSLLLIVVAAVAFATTRALRAAAQTPATTTTATSAATSKLLTWLGVPRAQWPEIEKHDPNFASELEKLRSDLAARRGELADAMEKIGSSDETIRGRSEALLAAGDTLQRRVIDHLLLIRDHLTPQQQKRLLGLCASAVRGGQGWQWRHGQDSGGAPGGGFGGGRGEGGRGRGGPPW